MLDLTEKEKQAIVAKVRRRTLAEAAAAGRRADPDFRKREIEYLRAHPNPLQLIHQHCGLCPDSEERPRRKVKLPNGIVLMTTWYRVPTTEAHARRDYAEQQWLCSEEGRRWYAATFKPAQERREAA